MPEGVLAYNNVGRYLAPFRFRFVRIGFGGRVV